MVSTRKKMNQQKRRLNQLDETSNDFCIGSSDIVNVSENENLEQETNGQFNDLEKVNDSVRQKQVTENEIDKQFSMAVRRAVMTVKNRMRVTILKAI